MFCWCVGSDSVSYGVACGASSWGFSGSSWCAYWCVVVDCCCDVVCVAFGDVGDCYFVDGFVCDACVDWSGRAIWAGCVSVHDGFLVLYWFSVGFADLWFIVVGILITLYAEGVSLDVGLRIWAFCVICWLVRPWGTSVPVSAVMSAGR